MTDLGDASDAGPPSHETSASPPPAKRTRLNAKGKTPTPSISASPPGNRVSTRRSTALVSSTSTSVAGDAHVFAPLIIPDVDPAPSAQDSRASSVMSTSGPHTRSRKRKADQFSSETPSVNGEPLTQASSLQDVNANHDATEESHVKLDAPDQANPENQDQDQDQEEDQDEDQDQEQQVTVSRRGRPPGKGRGAGKGKGVGRGGAKGRGKGKGGLSRQDSGVPETVKKPAGRGGRGKRTSANHMVQVAYDRQAHLKQNFKEVARMVRLGLDVLAEKSLDMVREDPLYHQQVSEYSKLTADLDAIRNAVISQHERQYSIRVEHARKKKEMDEEYAQMEFKCKIQDLKDKYEARCKAAYLDTIRRSKPVDDPSASVTPDEQANFRVISEERTDLVGGEASIGDVLETGTGPVRRTKRSSPKKRAVKEAPSNEPVAKRPSLLSAAAFPAEQPDDGQAPPEPILESALENQLEQQSKDADDAIQPLVSFPRFVRRGRQQEPNNRAVVKPHIVFEKHEIGFRNIYAEADGQPPQLKNFHLDVLSFSTGNGNGYNLSDHGVGDFDMNLVRRHRLHPQFGIPIPGCHNPDNVVPGTDFNKPVPRTSPITFITKDGKEIYETSRSATLMHTNEDWAHFEKLLDMKAAMGKFDPRELFTTTGLATFDSVAREADECRLGAQEILEAASEVEQNDAQAAKRQKLSAGYTPALASQVLGSFDDVMEIEREAFMRRSYPAQGGQVALETLANAALSAAQETARRSPAPAQFVHQTSIQTGTGFRSNYSPPKRNHSQAFSQMQGPGQKTKYFPAPKQASPQMMPAAATRPLPKRREPPLPVESTAPPQMNPESVAPRQRASMGPQSMALLSFVPQQMVPPARGSAGRAPLPMAPPTRTPQPMAATMRAPQSMVPQTRATLATAPASRANQSMAPQPGQSNSRAAQPIQQQLSALHPVTPQQAPITMAPPAVPNQQMGSQQAVPQMMSPRSMGPPPSVPPKMPSPTMGPRKPSPQAMGPPPTLPNPSQSTFTRPRNMTGGQTVLPVPTPSQMPSPQMHSPQHLSQPHPYFHGSQHPQQVHQQVQQPQQQPIQQQAQQPQQQLALATSRSNRAASSLPTLAPRPDRGRSNSRQVPRHHQHHYDNAATIPPFQGSGVAPPPERIYNYSTRDTYAQQQAQQQSHLPTQQQSHTQTQQQSYTQAQTQSYQQGHPQAYPQGHTQAQPKAHVQTQPQAQAHQFQAQLQQGHSPAQGQQYHAPVQQRQPQSPIQHFQHPPQQRQAQSSAPPYQQQPQPMQQQQAQQTQQLQPQSPSQAFQTNPQQHPTQVTPQSPATQSQQPEQPRQQRKSFGGGDGVEEREPYQSPISQFRPINKQYPSHPQQQRFQQHRSPYSNPPQRPTQQSAQQPSQQSAQQSVQQPGQQPTTQQQPSFNSLPPPPPPPPPGRRGMGSYGGYPDL